MSIKEEAMEGAFRSDRQMILDSIIRSGGRLSEPDMAKQFKDMNKRKRTKLLNDMVDDNEIELALEGDVPIYVHKKHITVPKEVEEFEEPIYRLIAETNNMGIWKRDLGNQLNIDKKELTKRLSSMEKRKLIKKISSNVDGNMKIRFILFGIEPDSSITGGAFVDGDRFDKELVENSTHLLKQHLQSLRDEANQKTASVIDAYRLSSVSAEATAKWLNSLNFVKFQLSPDDARQLLDSLVLEGFAIEQNSMYRAKMYDRALGTSGLSLTPCGVCPVASQCQPGGVISPESCKYLTDFLF